MMNLSTSLLERLRCPVTGSKLTRKGNSLESGGTQPRTYPVINGVPILINENRSLFSIDDFTQQRSTTFDVQESRLHLLAQRLLPDLSPSLAAAENFQRMAGLLPKGAVVLDIGGRIRGDGREKLDGCHSIEIVGTDVAFGPTTQLICDAHDIPFEDGTFDGVIVQAVMEHVVDPYRCVQEIHRVLKTSGLVYSETPFLQPVHMKQYDFTRFTHLGHRRLFRQFEEISSGACCGPAMALAVCYTGFLRSLTSSATVRRLLSLFAHLTAFFLKYLDYLLIRKPGAYVTASGYYFLGRKSESTLSDRDLIRGFRGFTG